MLLALSSEFSLSLELRFFEPPPRPPPPNIITLQVGPQKLQGSSNYLFFNFVKLLLHRKYVLDEIIQTIVRYVFHHLQIIFQ